MRIDGAVTRRLVLPRLCCPRVLPDGGSARRLALFGGSGGGAADGRSDSAARLDGWCAADHGIDGWCPGDRARRFRSVVRPHVRVCSRVASERSTMYGKDAPLGSVGGALAGQTIGNWISGGQERRTIASKLLSGIAAQFADGQLRRHSKSVIDVRGAAWRSSSQRYESCGRDPYRCGDSRAGYPSVRTPLL